MIHWAQAVCGRDQIVLFAPTLEDAISQDHSVRLFDEVLGKLNFAEWEQYYPRVNGRPPIHPRVMAQVIVYGLSLGIRSSRKLAALDQQIQGLMDESLATDEQEDELFGESSPMQLPRGLRDLKARQRRLEKAVKRVLSIEARQKAAGRSSESGPATPTTDPDASLMKNKTGGFAPNHLVVLGTEGKSGLIVDYQVPANPEEPSSVMPAVANIRESFGADAIKELLTDSAFNTGSNLQALKDGQIQPWMPPKRSTAAPENPTTGNAVTESENPGVAPGATSAAAPTPQPADTGKSKIKPFDKSLFVFQPASDTYRCPAGRSLLFWKNSSEKREGGIATIRVYRSTDCSNCPLASRCLSNQNRTKVRTLGRDQYEPLREEMAARMNTEAGRTKYRRRSFLAETPFAVLNTTMNVIQLLLRGTGKVTAEIGWICSAYNIKKITRLLAASRQPAMTNTT